MQCKFSRRGKRACALPVHCLFIACHPLFPVADQFFVSGTVAMCALVCALLANVTSFIVLNYYKGTIEFDKWR